MSGSCFTAESKVTLIYIKTIKYHNFYQKDILCTVKMNMLYLNNKIVATDYKQYYLLN